MRKWVHGALVLGTAVVGCESNYVYRPAENAAAHVQGYRAALYNIPKEAPRGDVRVASFGISKITPKDSSVAAPTRAMHVRMIIANNGQQPWTVDTGQQVAEIRGEGQVRPAY